VKVLKLSVVVAGRDDIELDLTGLYQNLVHLVFKICFAFPISQQL